MKNLIKSLKNLVLALLLFVVASILLYYLWIPATIVTLVAVFWKKRFFESINRLARIIYMAALGIDQFANVAFQEFWNCTLIKRKEGVLFGNPDETISGVLGKNKLNGSLSRVGKALDWVLDKLDPNHSIKSIEEDEARV